jgi:hypothetical protein
MPRRRAHIADHHDTLVTYDILRVVYGETDQTVLQFDTILRDGAVRKAFEGPMRAAFTPQRGRPPTDAELLDALMADQGIVTNREVLLLLQPLPGHPGAYQQTATFFDAPPTHALGDTESEILQVIEKGDYLSPRADVGDVFNDILRQSPLVVRATLQSLHDDESVWKPVRALRGALDTPTLTLSHHLFRLRATALVNAAAVTDKTLANPLLRNAAIHKKTQELVAREFTAGRNAVLFLHNVSSQGPTTTADLTARAFENLEALERDIQHPATLPAPL